MMMLAEGTAQVVNLGIPEWNGCRNGIDQAAQDAIKQNTSVINQLKDSEANTINVSVKKTDVTAEVQKADQPAIAAKCKEQSLVLSPTTFFDLSMYVNVNNGSEVKIEETGSPIKIQVNIPESIQKAGRTYYILRKHGNSVEIVGSGTASPVTIATDKFSTYAFAYAEAAESSSPHTPSSTSSEKPDRSSSGSSKKSSKKMSAPTASTKNASTQKRNTFTDVDYSSYSGSAIIWATEKGITKGTTATTFSPKDKVTRVQFVTFLWRLAGKPGSAYVVPFTDMPGSKEYQKAITWATEKGIVFGTSNTAFSLYATVTREQAATFLYRYYKGNASANNTTFTDVETNKYYTAPINWGSANGIIKGVGENRFNGKGYTTREQAVTFLYRGENR